jgi:putative redox protein
MGRKARHARLIAQCVIDGKGRHCRPFLFARDCCRRKRPLETTRWFPIHPASADHAGSGNAVAGTLMSKVSTASVVSTDTHYLHHIHVGRFDLDTDEPEALGGGGRAPAPFDYYLASLSACTAITLRMYAERKGWNLGQLRIELVLSFDDDGKAHVHRTLHSDQSLSDGQWQRLLEIAGKTPVTKVMRDGAAITSERGA